MFLSVTLSDLNDLIAQLDHRADLAQEQPNNSGRPWVQRRHRRYPFRVTCTVRIFPQGCEHPLELQGRTRNLSRGGVGLLVRRALSTNDPVEVEIAKTADRKLFMAGTVRWCRYAGMGFHEIGVELKMAGGAPVLPRTIDNAQRILEWLRQA